MRSQTPVDPAAGPPNAGTVNVRRLYAQYLREAGLTFDDLLVIAELSDGGEHEVADLATRLKLDAAQMSSIIANLEAARLVDRLYPSSSRLSSIRLVIDTRRLAGRLLVIQANVDLDLSIVSDEVDHLRKSLLLLARRSSARCDAR